jgi:hypothetical protein
LNHFENAWLKRCKKRWLKRCKNDGKNDEKTIPGIIQAGAAYQDQPRRPKTRQTPP